jgi:hypothetical protein
MSFFRKPIISSSSTDALERSAIYYFDRQSLDFTNVVLFDDKLPYISRNPLILFRGK